MLACVAFLVSPLGCSSPVPTDSIVVTQIPRGISAGPTADVLDRSYPSGSRIVLLGSASDPVRLLSQGLIAAGEPVASFDGKRVVFAGKASQTSEWQIYEASLVGGPPRPLTSVHGGATDPLLLGDGALVYVSPVPSSGADPVLQSSALYLQRVPGRSSRLTFNTARVCSPTILSDGRILFVSSSPGVSEFSTGLYTINNDGTEVSAFSGHQERMMIRRPRQVPDGRVVFLTSGANASCEVRAESISMARPFGGTSALFPACRAHLSSVQPDSDGGFLVCADREAAAVASGVFRLNADARSLGTPVFLDPKWSSIEAVPITQSVRPMGRLSNVDPLHRTGQILCLNANDTTCSESVDGLAPKAAAVRVTTASSGNIPVPLGEVKLQPDGSFMAEVPADIPLGFEALDQTGRVLRRVNPFIWVRPGENRACIGCHERPNHSPKNLRPLAVRVAVPLLEPAVSERAGKNPE